MTLAYAKVDSIQWDTDGEDRPDLPLCVSFPVDIPFPVNPDGVEDNYFAVVDKLSDKYGFCVTGCNVQFSDVTGAEFADMLEKYMQPNRLIIDSRGMVSLMKLALTLAQEGALWKLHEKLQYVMSNDKDQIELYRDFDIDCFGILWRNKIDETNPFHHSYNINQTPWMRGGMIYRDGEISIHT